MPTMNDEQTQEHIELQQKTIEDQNAEMAKRDIAAKKVQDELDTLKALPRKDDDKTTDPVILALRKELDDSKLGTAKLQETIDQGVLTKEFPKITDWTVVTGKTIEEKRVNAKKISDLIGDTAPPVKLDKDGKPIPVDPGEKFKGAPPVGGVTAEQLAKDKQIAGKKDLKDLMSKGDVKGVMEKCFELQPAASTHLFAAK